MPAWLRKEEEPDKSLTEARKELVHSYMDAEEAETRRQAVEQLERQSRSREQARLTAGQDAVRRQTAAAADAEARREDEDVAQQVAAAAAEAREEAQREAEEETARQVAAAVEQALRQAKEETERQVAEAVARARQEAADTAPRPGAGVSEPAPERPREPEPAEQDQPVATTLGEARPTVPEQPVAEPAGEAQPESDQETPRGDVAPPEVPAGRSAAGLPLSKRIEAVTQPDEAAARVDWTRELLRAKKNARPRRPDA